LQWIVTLHYFTEFSKTCISTHNRIDLWRNLCTSLLYSVVRVRCRHKESSRSLSHLLMSFLSILSCTFNVCVWTQDSHKIH